MLDAAIFIAGVFIVYKYGHIAAEYVENQLPTEEKMIRMMQEMEMQQRMM